MKNNGATTIQEAAGETRFRARPAYYALAVLFLVNLCGYLDRQILALLVAPIRESLGISDTMIGLLQGLAFVTTFSLAGLFMGQLVDRHDRRKLLIGCVAIWSLATALSGLVVSGGQLFLARMFVGVGEAALFPAAVSLIADYFDESRRGGALGIFVTGTHLGIGISLALVGMALPSLALLSGELARSGIDLEPWRLVMLTMLIPGLICCAMLWHMEEPRRQGPPAKARSWRAGFADWKDQADIFVPHHLAVALTGLSLYAMGAWFPTILIRQYGMPAGETGMSYGTLIALSGVGAAFIMGRAGDWVGRSRGVRGHFLLTMVTTPFAFVAFAIIMTGPAPDVLLACAALANFMLVAAWVVGLLALSSLAPARSRGNITAMLLLVNGLLGQAAGPAAIGILSDSIGGPTWPLSRILGMVGAAACALSFLCLLIARHRASLRPAGMSPEHGSKHR